MHFLIVAKNNKIKKKRKEKTMQNKDNKANAKKHKKTKTNSEQTNKQEKIISINFVQTSTLLKISFCLPETVSWYQPL